MKRRSRAASSAAAPAVPKAGWRISQWCASVGISRPLYYTLQQELRPRVVRLRGVPIIAESPDDYLQRIAALQAEARRETELVAA